MPRQRRAAREDQGRADPGAAAPTPARTADKAAGAAARARARRASTFRQVDRLKRFLNFIVSEALAGRGDQLKEYVIGVQVFDKDSSFDPRADPIVRVQARRLRARLVRYYREEGGSRRADHRAAEGRLRAGLQEPRGAAALAPLDRDRRWPDRTRSRCSRSRTTARRRTSRYFCDGLRQEIIHSLRQARGAAGARRAAGERDRPAATAVTTPARPRMLLTGGVREVRRPRARHGPSRRHRDRVVPLVRVGRRARSAIRSRRRNSVAEAVVAEARAAAARRRPASRRAPAGREPRGAQPLSAGPLSPEPAHRRRAAEGARLLREGDRRGRAVRARAQRAGRRARAARPLRRARAVAGRGRRRRRAPRRRSCSTATAPKGGPRWRTSRRRRTGTGTAPSASSRCAISLDPRYATAHHWYAMSCLVPLGRLDEALDEMRIAQSLDPVSSIVARDVALIHAYRRDFEAALEQCDHTIELNPHFSPAYWALGRDPGTAQGSRRGDRRVPARDRSVAAQPAHARRPRPRAGARRARSRSRSPRSASSTRSPKQRYVSPIEFAAVRFALGQRELGFRWLDKAARTAPSTCSR